MSKKKICFIAQFPPPIHGLSKAVDTLYNSRLQDKYEFTKINITNNKKIFLNLLQLIESDADLFYFTISQTKGGNLRDLIIFKLLELRKKKCIIHLHGGYYRQLVDYHMSSWQRKANYKAVSKLSGTIVLGKSLVSIFQGMIPDNRIFIVPNCVDDEYIISDSEFEKKLRMLDHQSFKHVLYLSNFIEAKGYPLVLEMAKEEKKHCDKGEVKKFHFDFAGKFFNEKDKHEFFKYIYDNSLEGFVTYHGVVEGEKKKELLKLGNVFVLLTKYPNEGQPISILEAMGNGLAVLTTNHAGIPDIVKDMKNGIVIDKNNIDSLNCYEAMKKMHNYKNIIKANRSIVVEQFSQENYIANMDSTFKEILMEEVYK